MQIIEVTDLGVRSAAITLARDDSAMEFILFPMIHFAEPAFYAEVRRRLKKCAVIVSEGVAGPTLQSNAMDFANRYFPRGHQHGIVGQTDEIVLPAGIPVIRPDVSPAVPALDLRNVPGLKRLALVTGINLALVTSAHVISTALALAGPRVLCDQDLAIHDFPFTALEAEAMDSEFVHILTDTRDVELLRALTEVHEQRHLEPIKVGVVYGAGHMPAVSNGLADRYRYRPRKAEWMTIYAG